MKVRVIAEPDWLPELAAHLECDLAREEGPADMLVVPWEKTSDALDAFDDEIPVPTIWVVPKDAGRLELERLADVTPLRRFVFQDTAGAVAAAVRELAAHLPERSSPAGHPDAGTAGAGTAGSAEDGAGRAQESMGDRWSRFQVALLDGLTVLENVGAEILEGDMDPERLADAHHAAHELRESLGTFGVRYGSALAAELEDLVGGWLDETELSEGDRYRYSEIVVGLRREIESGRPSDPAERRAGPSESGEMGGRVLIVESDADRRQKLAAAGRSRGWRPHPVATPGEALDALAADGRPALAVLDPGAGDPDDLGRLLEELASGSRAVPVVIQGRTRSLEEPLKAGTMAARVFVDREAGPEAVMGRAASLMDQENDGAIRVLAVDDDPDVLRVLTFILRGAGYVTRTLTSPLGFWRKLEAVDPDVLLLDVEMPDVHGLQLCRAVRDDDRWSDLPILLLTSGAGTGTVIEAFEAGADDIVPKPVAGPELLARIGRRVRSGNGTGGDVDRDGGGAEGADGAAMEPEAGPEGRREHGEAAGGEGHDIVVVEHDEALGTLVRQTLEDRGYGTHWIKDGAEAADLLTGQAPSVRGSVIILDVDLPGMDGLSLLRRLARDGVTDRTRVLMLTTRSAESEVVKALELGAFDHVPKPFSVSELIHRVRRALGREAR